MPFLHHFLSNKFTSLALLVIVIGALALLSNNSWSVLKGELNGNTVCDIICDPQENHDTDCCKGNLANHCPKGPVNYDECKNAVGCKDLDPLKEGLTYEEFAPYCFYGSDCKNAESCAIIKDAKGMAYACGCQCVGTNIDDSSGTCQCSEFGSECDGPDADGEKICCNRGINNGNRDACKEAENGAWYCDLDVPGGMGGDGGIGGTSDPTGGTSGGSGGTPGGTDGGTDSGGTTGGDTGGTISGDTGGPGPGPGPGSTSSAPVSSAASKSPMPPSSAASSEASKDPSSDSSTSSQESSSEESSEASSISSESSDSSSESSSSESSSSESSESSSAFSSSEISSSQSSDATFCGDGIIQEEKGEECDNGSVCSNNQYLTCLDDVPCNLCFIINQETGEARCAANVDGTRCFGGADCEQENAACNYNIPRNAECLDTCRFKNGSSSSAFSQTSNSSQESLYSNMSNNSNTSNASTDSNGSLYSNGSTDSNASTDSNGSTDSQFSNDSSFDSANSDTSSIGSGGSNASDFSAGSSESTIIAFESSTSSEPLFGIGVCGNGVTEGLEQCDDGNHRSGDGCSEFCDRETTEEDDGTEDDTDNDEGDDTGDTGDNGDSDDTGDSQSSQGMFCGNGIQEADEQCDDGNIRNNDGCSSTCRFIEVFTGCYSDNDCLDGVCRDGNCTPCFSHNECGEGVCSSGKCQGPKLVAAASVCGNGVLEEPEECDDRNRRDNDGCSSTCLLEIGICGDGVVQSLLGEQCESSTHESSLEYACSNCRFVSTFCGNEVVDPGEECDSGPLNSTSADALCRPDCGLARCGDGIVDSAELCDDGNLLPNDGCDRYCRTEEGPVTVVASEYTPPAEVQQPQQYQFPNQPSYQQLPYQLPLAQLRPLIQTQGPIGDTGPAAVAVIGAGAAAGVGWMRRRKRK
jgi:cysteine-rich repeat protein